MGDDQPVDRVRKSVPLGNGKKSARRHESIALTHAQQQLAAAELAAAEVDDGLGLDINFVSEKAIRFAYGLAVLKQRAGWLLKLLPGFLLTMFNQAIYFYTDYVCRGKRFLVDRAGLSRKLNKIEQIFPFKADNDISLGRLQNAIDEFWQNAWRMAIKLYRNELFIAKYECDHAMVSNLLLLITVYTKFKKGKNLETWNKGKNIEKWAPPFIVEGIRQIYSRYDGGDTWRGLMATINLFDKVYNLLIQEEDFQSLKSPGETINKWVNDLKCKHEVEVI